MVVILAPMMFEASDQTMLNGVRLIKDEGRTSMNTFANTPVALAFTGMPVLIKSVRIRKDVIWLKRATFGAIRLLPVIGGGGAVGEPA